MNRALLVAFAPIVLGIASIACNGKVATPDESGSTSARQLGGKAENDKGQKQDDPPKGALVATSGNVAPGANKPAPDDACTYEYQSSSSSSSGGNGPQYTYACESKDNYTCNGAPKDITCSCSGADGKWNVGSCSCNGITFEFDCNNACSPGPAEYAKCNLPLPDDYGTTGGGSSTSSSSGSTSSSSGG